MNQMSDDSDYSSEFLYTILKDARALLLKRKADSFHKISEWDWQSYCVGLEFGKSHNCDCVDVGCDVLKSKDMMPRPIIGRNKELFKVQTLDGTLLPYADDQQVVYFKHDDFKKGKPAYMIDGDNKLVIWNNTDLRAVVVRGVFNDPTEWEGIQLCDENGDTTGTCFSASDDEFPIDPNLNMAMYELALKMLGMKLQIPDDQTNDANDDIKV